jgi:RNA polymerase sigma-70 factor (ECF subfamily)
MANDDRSEPQTDADALVARARTDRESFGRLYDLYYDRIYRHCVRRLYRPCVAEEACSEVFLYVASHIHRFRGTTENEFRCWLYGIATNTINGIVRRKLRRNELMNQAIDRRAFEKPAEVAPSDLEPLDWPRLYEEIALLDVREQAIVMLRYFEQMTHDEIARTLNLRSGTVRVALSRALEKLRRRLATREQPRIPSPDKRAVRDP